MTPEEREAYINSLPKIGELQKAPPVDYAAERAKRWSAEEQVKNAPPEETISSIVKNTWDDLNPSSIFLLSLLVILITSQICKKAKVFGILPALVSKLFRSLVITRTVLEKHWWHRMAKAIIIGSTPVFFLILTVLDGRLYYYPIDFLIYESHFLLLSILWFLFLDSIIYRAILYVVYGKKT